jgi:hypothetical protein
VLKDCAWRLKRTRTGLTFTTITEGGAFFANVRIGQRQCGGHSAEIGLGPTGAVAAEVPLVLFACASIFHAAADAAQRFVGRGNRAGDSGNLTGEFSTVHAGHTLKLTGGLSMWRILIKAPVSFGQLGHLALKCQCSPLNRNSIQKANVTSAYAVCTGETKT